MAGKASSSVPASMMDGLSALLPDIAVCMAAPDADIEFLDKLQKIVLLRIHQPSGAKGPPGAPSGAPQSPGGTPGPGGGGAPGALQGQGLPGGPPGAGAANGQMRSQGAPQPPTEPGGVSKPMTPDPEMVRREMALAAGSDGAGG